MVCTFSNPSQFLIEKHVFDHRLTINVFAVYLTIPSSTIIAAENNMGF